MALTPPPPSPPRQAAPGEPDLKAIAEELLEMGRRLIIVARDIEREIAKK